MITIRTKHGGCGTRLYTIWQGIRQRCLFTSCKESKHYHDKGITICDEWNSFTAFRSWAMANGYNDSLTIDRINIKGNYEPSNCEWVTRSENTRRQNADGSGHRKPISLIQVFDNTHIKFKTIEDAALFVRLQSGKKQKSTADLLSRRLNADSVKPYYGYICRRTR